MGSGVIATHRTFPDRKTLGTRFNLKPATESVEARRLKPGDVVVLEAESPAVISKVVRLGTVSVKLWLRYIWQADFDPHWPAGTFPAATRIDRARRGEYLSPTR